MGCARGAGSEINNVMPRTGIAYLFCACLAGAAYAQDEMNSRLSQERVGDIEPGTYAAGRTTFLLDGYGDKYLLRVAGDPEAYVLYSDHVPLGGRALKYDPGHDGHSCVGLGRTDTLHGLRTQRDPSPRARATLCRHR